MGNLECLKQSEALNNELMGNDFPKALYQKSLKENESKKADNLIQQLNTNSNLIIKSEKIKAEKQTHQTQEKPFQKAKVGKNSSDDVLLEKRTSKAPATKATFEVQENKEAVLSIQSDCCSPAVERLSKKRSQKLTEPKIPIQQVKVHEFSIQNLSDNANDVYPKAKVMKNKLHMKLTKAHIVQYLGDIKLPLISINQNVDEDMRSNVSSKSLMKDQQAKI